MAEQESPSNRITMIVNESKPIRVRAKRPPKAPKETKPVEEGPKEVPAVKVDQRTETARSGRRTKLAKPGEVGGVPLSKVDYTVIKNTKDPLAVRDQLMREYFASERHTDELVQKLCALVFKHH